MQKSLFQSRTAAGKSLAEKLQHYANRTDTLILALPRGGVPAAFEVSQALRIPLELVVIRKLGLPGREEFVMGAIASGGVEIRNKEIIDILSIKTTTIDKIRDEQTEELKRIEKAYRGDLNWPHYKADNIIIIDDSIAKDYDIRVAIEVARDLDAKRIIVAAPVAAKDALAAIAPLVDEAICLSTPEQFTAAEKYYEDFSQVTDEEVHRLIKISWKH